MTVNGSEEGLHCRPFTSNLIHDKNALQEARKVFDNFCFQSTKSEARTGVITNASCASVKNYSSLKKITNHILRDTTRWTYTSNVRRRHGRPTLFDNLHDWKHHHGIGKEQRKAKAHFHQKRKNS